MKKKNTYWLIAIAALVVLMALGLAGCGSSEQAEPEPAENTQQEAAPQKSGWYDSVLADEETRKDYPYYRLLDIDQDGTDELFLSSTENYYVGNEDKAKLMGFVDDKATVLKEIGGAGGESFGYDASDKSLFYYSRLSGEEHLVKYQYKKGSLVKVQTADEYDPGHDPKDGANKGDTYYLDGKQVSEDKADVLWDQYDDKAEDITYSKDGKGIPPESVVDIDDDDDDFDEDREEDND